MLDHPDSTSKPLPWPSVGFEQRNTISPVLSGAHLIPLLPNAFRYTEDMDTTSVNDVPYTTDTPA